MADTTPRKQPKRQKSALDLFLRPFAGKSPTKSAADDGKQSQAHEQLRRARSHAALLPSTAFFAHPPAIVRAVRRAGSTPALTTNTSDSTPTARSAPLSGAGTPATPARKPSSGTRGDVLGRILGWTTPPAAILAQSSESTSQLAFAFGDRSLYSSAKLDNIQVETLEGRHSLETKDLPTDLVRELGLGRHRLSGSPFGANVRLHSIHRQRDASTSTATPTRKMRAVASSDSVRTARDLPDVDVRPARKRYESISVFDMLQEIENTAGKESLAHARLPSMASLVSDVSDRSHLEAQIITVVTTVGNDPRFVLYGYTPLPRPKTQPPATASLSASISSSSLSKPPPESPASENSPALSGSSRFSINPRASVTTPATSVRNSISSNASGAPVQQQRFMMAATVERLVAELTSQIEAELLTSFFLCYRSFLQPVDLLSLLITRFEWALMPTTTPEDEAGRRIVRVRTFVVLRYWLLNHFEDDFVPNKQVRTKLADWLNACSRSPALISSPKDMRLIKSLKKLVKRVKSAHLAVLPQQPIEAAQLLEKLGHSVAANGARREWSDEEVDLEGHPHPKPSITKAHEPDLGAPVAPPLSDEARNALHPVGAVKTGTLGKIKSAFTNRASMRPEKKERSKEVAANVLSSKNKLEEYLSYYDIPRPTLEVPAIAIVKEQEEEPKVMPPQVGTFSDSLHPDAGPPRPLLDAIAIDDLDSSDDDDEDVSAIKKSLRRLPGRDNLRVPAVAPVSFRLSIETAESYGEVWTSEIDRASVISFAPEEEFEGGAVVPYFVGEGLDGSDEDEPGDVEAALRRLEGIVDDAKEQRKAERVARQIQKSQELENASRAASAASAVPPTPELSSDSVSVISYSSSLSASMSSHAERDPPTTSIAIDVTPASPIRPSKSASASRPDVTLVNKESLTAPAPASSTTKTVGRKSSFAKLLSLARPLSLRPLPATRPPVHRSFLLSCRTEVVAKQLCLIERDLLGTVHWRDLVDGSWLSVEPAIDVLDWEEYLKDSRRAELASRTLDGAAKTKKANVAAIVARFNLTANWVCSELVLTRALDDRTKLLAKFIRLAFKCYLQCNFQTMTQIVYALLTPEVSRLRKTWAALPKWEARQFEGMKRFVSVENNFKHLRQLATSLITQHGAAEQSTAESNDSKSRKANTAAFVGCIPFFGVFLHDLSMHEELPTFLDPSTHEPAKVDSQGELLSVDKPDAFDELPSLPSHERLRPLVNVHKLRITANVVQQVLASQRLSQRYPWEAERSLYFACLKLRCLPTSIIHECSRQIEP